MSSSKQMRINHITENARFWDSEAEQYFDSHPEHRERTLHPSWGIWHVPERQLLLLGNAPQGRLLELGCGQGHDAIGFASYGLEVIGVDISREQLSYAQEHPNVRLIHGPAEHVPIEDESMDFVTSDHGAFDHSPIPGLLAEARRVLKPGGALIVCTSSPIAFSCYNFATGRVDEMLRNDYPTDRVLFDGKSVGTELSYAAWIASFRQFGFEIERLEEIRVTPDAVAYFADMCDVGWATRWPSDIAWVVRRDS